MDDREFFDHLFALYARTSGQEASYWRPESTEGGYSLFAVHPDDTRTLVAAGLTEADADWVAAIHGALPDMVRRLHAALDEAERVDEGRDARECRIAELELELAEVKGRLDAEPHA